MGCLNNYLREKGIKNIKVVEGYVYSKSLRKRIPAYRDVKFKKIVVVKV
jgi:hypothetical protein